MKLFREIFLKLTMFLCILLVIFVNVINFQDLSNLNNLRVKSKKLSSIHESVKVRSKELMEENCNGKSENGK